MRTAKKKHIVILIAAELLIALAVGAYLLISTPGWHHIGGSRLLYTEESGRPATGYTVIGDKPYFFDRFGMAAREGFVKNGGDTFYCLGNGELATGWQYIGDKAYYFYEENQRPDDKLTGAQAVDYVTSGGIPISEKGYLEGKEALAVAYAIDVLDRYGWDLESAYKYSASLRFEGDSEQVYGFRIHNCAYQGFKYGVGNCLAWSGTFCAMAKVMGYDSRLIWGTLPYRGEDVPHGWVEIWEDDGIHVYDPRKNEGVDMAGFDVRYGAKGTRAYNEDSKQYMEW